MTIYGICPTNKSKDLSASYTVAIKTRNVMTIINVLNGPYTDEAGNTQNEINEYHLCKRVTKDGIDISEGQDVLDSWGSHTENFIKVSTDPGLLGKLYSEIATIKLSDVLVDDFDALISSLTNANRIDATGITLTTPQLDMLLALNAVVTYGTDESNKTTII